MAFEKGPGRGERAADGFHKDGLLYLPDVFKLFLATEWGMVSLFLIMYGGADAGYGADQYGSGESVDYSGAGADRYLAELFDGADSYIDMLLGGDGDGSEYGHQDQLQPYNNGSGRNADGNGGYESDRYGKPHTVITVFYDEMYEPSYEVFRM